MKALMVILTAIFTGAKLAGAIHWSWWLVFAPVFIYCGGWALLVLISWIIFLIYWLWCITHIHK